MSALVLVEAGFTAAEAAEMRVAQQARMQALVREAREFALRDPNQWRDAYHDLTEQQENAIVFAVMHADRDETYRLMREYLQAEVLERATDRAKDRIAERFGVDLDAAA